MKSINWNKIKESYRENIYTAKVDGGLLVQSVMEDLCSVQNSFAQAICFVPSPEKSSQKSESKDNQGGKIIEWVQCGGCSKPTDILTALYPEAEAPTFDTYHCKFCNNKMHIIYRTETA